MNLQYTINYIYKCNYIALNKIQKKKRRQIADQKFAQNATQPYTILDGALQCNLKIYKKYAHVRKSLKLNQIFKLPT